MGTKVADELFSTVRSIVGSEHSDMDIIRALHLAKNDPAAAINIILDSLPTSMTKERRPESELLNSTPPSVKRKRTDHENGSNGSVDRRDVCRIEDANDNESMVDASDWWLVGYSEVAGLSTSKGRKVKPGDEVYFTFPSVSTQMRPSSLAGKAFGRGKNGPPACSEIVRFSTKSSGEVIQY